jgi:metal-responsive CopG/Arc/MetJ family transcriptional regulator
MGKRISVTLPEHTLAVLDRVTTRGNRSRFVSEAVLHYVHAQGKQSLRDQLKAGYQANAAENLKINRQWSHLEPLASPSSSHT